MSIRNSLKREATVIWWNTSKEENIKRLIKRGRTAEKDLEYFKTLSEIYKENIIEVYQNIEVITRETLLTEEQVEEYLPYILNEEKVKNRTNSF